MGKVEWSSEGIHQLMRYAIALIWRMGDGKEEEVTNRLLLRCIWSYNKEPIYLRVYGNNHMNVIAYI